MTKINLDRKINLLDWGIIFATLVMLVMIYIPQIIWNEENNYKKESRHRMTVIANAQEFLYEMTGDYSVDGKFLFDLVEAAMDSSLADSLFINKQFITLPAGETHMVNIHNNFGEKVDTTFSFPVPIKKVMLDTIYTIGIRNKENNSIDTLFANGRDINIFLADTTFYKIFSSDTVSRSERSTDYLRKKYHLDYNLLQCPVTKIPYIFEISTDDQGEKIFNVKSPIPGDYSERRYLIFKFKPRNHGEILSGTKSWAE